MIKQTERRPTIQVSFPDGRIFEGSRGTTVETFVRQAFPKAQIGHIVAALLNGRLRELTTPLNNDTDVAPITTAAFDGSRIYRRSLSFLVIAAAAELFPEDIIVIHHSMPFGGFYCERQNGQPFDQSHLDQLKQRMRELVAENLPIRKEQIPLEEALELFHASGDEEKAQLFAKRRKDYLTIYELNGVKDYFHGFMVPTTGYLNLFDLRPYSSGFILQFPRRHQPNVLQPFEDEPRLAHVFQEYSRWLRIVETPTVSAFNRAVENGRLQELILVAEALHQQQLSQIAAQISNRRDSVRLILISGPTSAGKTTFSKRLAIQLLAHGIFPITIGMDNYFVNREDTPRDENGRLNFEAVEAVDIPLFQDHLKQLMDGKTIRQPIYNFHTGMRERGEKLAISPQHVIIIEGIHGLNPRLVSNLPNKSIYRIFINAFTQLNLDKHNRVPSTNTRLLRRIVRDAAHRGYTAADTIRRWGSVRRGEKRYIFPYQNNANVFFNSALVYELAAMKTLAQPLLLQVEPGTPERPEANRLMAFLQWFDPLPTEALAYIGSDSILREFIGGSTLTNYEPGHW